MGPGLLNLVHWHKEEALKAAIGKRGPVHIEILEMTGRVYLQQTVEDCVTKAVKTSSEN